MGSSPKGALTISRHYILALVIAPFLAALAWFSVGKLSTATPQSSQVGQSYPLVEKSNCRYASGACDLENVDIEVRLTYQEGAQGGYLQLDSSHPLTGAIVSVAPPEADPEPLSMVPAVVGAKRWTLPLPVRPDAASRIRLVLSVAGSTYFVEASAVFLHVPP